MVRKKSDKLYVIKTAPGREDTVINAIERYYKCKEGEKYGDVIEVREDVDVEAKVGTHRKFRIPIKRRREMREELMKKKAAELGVPESEVDVPMSDIPMYREQRKSALGLFGGMLHREDVVTERRVCLVDDVLVPELKSYIVISTNSRKEASEVVKRIKHAWKVLDGTVSRRELEMNIKELEEKSRLDKGDIVIPQSGTCQGVRSEVVGVTFDGRLMLKTIEGSVPITFTIGKDKLLKE